MSNILCQFYYQMFTIKMIFLFFVGFLGGSYLSYLYNKSSNSVDDLEHKRGCDKISCSIFNRLIGLDKLNCKK